MARLRDGAQCRYHLEPGRWYPVVGNWPHANPQLTQWALALGAGEPPLLVEAMYLDLGPDDPEAFARWAEDCRLEELTHGAHPLS